MDNTTRFDMPLVMAAQAQKHVTVNEALSRIDGAMNMVLQSLDLTMPPAQAVDGMAYAVPFDGVNDWAGQGGKIALASNGGWEFLTPRAGWRAFVSDQGRGAIHDGTDWVPGALTMSAHGAGLAVSLCEIDHVLGAGSSELTDLVIAPSSMVIGVTARVVEPITGDLTGWRLGTPGAEDRFGSGLGLAAESWVRGMLGQPVTYWGADSLLITAEGGSFTGGRLRLAVHALELTLPRS